MREITPEVLSAPLLTNEEKLKMSLRDRELLETDVTTRVVLQKIREALDACLVASFQGTMCQTTIPDHDTRLKAIAEAREILGLSGPKNAGMAIPKITIVRAEKGSVVNVKDGI